VFKTTLITKKRPLWPYLALYVQFLRCALFTKATPTDYTIRCDFNCHINERETPKTCLTNHKSSISHHTIPLVINSLGGGDTHTQTLWTKVISRNQARAGQSVPGLKTVPLMTLNCPMQCILTLYKLRIVIFNPILYLTLQCHKTLLID